MRVFFWVFVSLMLSGCVAKRYEPISTTCLPSNSVSVRYHDNPEADMSEAEYMAKIRKIISSKMYNSSMYKGQECTVRLNARNQTASVDYGDFRLCLSLLYAISSSSFPVVPEGIKEQDANALMSIPVKVKF
ncbi:hypothetical protein AN2351V1_1705 [Citrobacter koseri]|uniref:cell envelope integrity TolA C-terminal domain-containing protein n=4 Tax=Enterobacteriaceae TaxID=543 RepID=UPI001D309070|nr:hypothetical protein AN2351V1_1705 [Citrobacter koseri]CAG0259224.1 hypothetical protein AN2353V1_2473 [Citrobacter koseri]CAH6029284.1 hypothetical protein AN2351V1_1705 [Citrobacter koseri]CAH6083357.1 hypothetical protein AN2353V1_2473 [Citrobacter koseri]